MRRNLLRAAQCKGLTSRDAVLPQLIVINSHVLHYERHYPLQILPEPVSRLTAATGREGVVVWGCGGERERGRRKKKNEKIKKERAKMKKRREKGRREEKIREKEREREREREKERKKA